MAVIFPIVLLKSLSSLRRTKWGKFSYLLVLIYVLFTHPSFEEERVEREKEKNRDYFLFSFREWSYVQEQEYRAFTWGIEHLSRWERAHVNLRHSADFLNNFAAWYLYDLGTLGQKLSLSPYGFGPDGHRLLFNNRFYRDPFSGRPAYLFLSPLQVGSVHILYGGSYEGLPAGVGLVVFEPLSFELEEPITHLSYRDGFYGFEPVEFVHSKKIGKGGELTFGGFFPAWSGRIPHSRYRGRSLWGRYQWFVAPKKKVSIYYQDGLHRTEIPYPLQKNQLFRRWDGDGEIQWKWGEERITRLNLFQSQTIEKANPLREWAREIGGSVFHQHSSHWGFSFWWANLEGILGENYPFSYWDGEVTSSLQWVFDSGKLWALWGMSGTKGEKFEPVGSLGGEIQQSRLGILNFNLFHQVLWGSPRTRFAHYSSGNRPVDYTTILWTQYPNAAISGKKHSPSRVDGAQVKWMKSWGKEWEWTFSLFYWVHHNSFIWRLSSDTLISHDHLRWREGKGWSLVGKYLGRNWRGKGEFIWSQLDQSPLTWDPTIFPEPMRRAFLELGWHSQYLNERFEVDALVRGWYFAPFDHPLKRMNEKMGGGYPLEMRFAFRIARFQIYYGIWNVNDYRFFLVPQYPVMHKEEYWGIEWSLVN
ncbi:MAG: hypothetical protein ACK4OO_03725 [bacterium]